MTLLKQGLTIGIDLLQMKKENNVKHACKTSNWENQETKFKKGKQFIRNCIFRLV